MTHLVGGNLIHVKYLDSLSLYDASKAKHDYLNAGTSDEGGAGQFPSYTECYGDFNNLTDKISSKATDQTPSVREQYLQPHYLQPGFRHAICIASQSEQSAYKAVISGSAVIPEAESSEFYVASCAEHHANCKFCGNGPMFLLDQDRPALRVDLSVLGICRQLYEEANHLLWTTNVFSFGDPRTFEKFFDSLVCIFLN